MRSTKLWVALAMAAVAIVGTTAKAQIIVTQTKTAGTGSYAGQDIVRFFAAFGPASVESLAGASGLQSVKATLSIPTGTFKFITGQFLGAPNATNPDVDPFGVHGDDNTYRNLTDIGDVANFQAMGSGVFIHDPNLNGFSVQGYFTDDVSRTPTGNNNTNNTTNGFKAVETAKSFRVEGFIQQPGGGDVGSDPQAKTASVGQVGKGALFAVAVVPTGTVVRAQGTLAGDKGPSTNFDTAVPEPATFGLLGLGAVGLLARRRRAA